MAREDRQHRQIRERIAQLAARLMAEDGIEDFGVAKRKAARQLGTGESRSLPSNDDVETALHAYRSMYQAEEQHARLQALRTLALEMMHVLEKFDPHLSGSVLSGNAGRYAEIDIDLFTDAPKVVEYFLIESGMEFKGRERRVYVGENARTVPSFKLETEEAIYNITVFQSHDVRTVVRTTPAGRPIERIRSDRLHAKIDLDLPDS